MVQTEPAAARAAFHGTAEERRAIAAQPRQAPEVLVLLATDADPGVRRAVAENAGAPPMPTGCWPRIPIPPSAPPWPASSAPARPS